MARAKVKTGLKAADTKELRKRSAEHLAAGHSPQEAARRSLDEMIGESQAKLKALEPKAETIRDIDFSLHATD